jgi:hypothetical protein
MSTNANTSRSIYANHISAACTAALLLVEYLSAARQELQGVPSSDLSELDAAYEAACRAWRASREARLIFLRADVDANGVA